LNSTDRKSTKSKLKIGVIGHDKGDELWNAFKHYNMLLLEKAN